MGFHMIFHVMYIGFVSSIIAGDVRKYNSGTSSQYDYNYMINFNEFATKEINQRWSESQVDTSITVPLSCKDDVMELKALIDEANMEYVNFFDLSCDLTNYSNYVIYKGN